jgi:hypothetical protein
MLNKYGLYQKVKQKMISAILVGLGLIAAAVGSFASEIYLAKTVGKESLVLNHGYNSHKAHNGGME